MAARWVGGLLYVLAMAVLAVLLPSRMGFAFLDPLVVAGYASLSVIFASAKIGPETRATIIATLFGWLSASIALAAGLVTVNAHYRYGSVLLPSVPVLAAAVVFSLAAAAFAASVGARLILRGWQPQSAKAALRRSFFVIVLALLLSQRILPDAWRDAAAVHLTSQGIARLLALGSVLLGVPAAFLFPRVRP